MPEYTIRCTRPMCARYGQPQEVACSMQQRDSLRCQHCGAAVETHPDQYAAGASIKVQREWHGLECNNNEITFAPDADLKAIQRDVPAMELRRTKAGYLKPVSRNDAHDRRWKKQFSRAIERYQQQGDQK